MRYRMMIARHQNRCGATHRQSIRFHPLGPLELELGRNQIRGHLGRLARPEQSNVTGVGFVIDGRLCSGWHG